jgi:hypothetical protein
VKSDPPKPAPEEELPDSSGNNRQFRQERIIAVEQDKKFPYGDLHRPKTPGYDRLFWCNPNGISHHRDLLDFQEISRSMRDADTDRFGLAEPNLDWLRPEIRKKCEDIMNDFFGTHILAPIYSLPLPAVSDQIHPINLAAHVWV